MLSKKTVSLKHNKVNSIFNNNSGDRLGLIYNKYKRKDLSITFSQ